MQLKQTSKSEHSPKITLSRKYSSRQQTVHALAINIIPALGLLAAIGLIVKQGIYLWEIILWLVFHMLTAAGITVGLLSGFLWGGCLRLFLSYHFTQSINSITHLYGSRPFNTHEWSTNNIWLALPTFGEAWHNNHHAFPNSAKFGLKFWQIDLGYWVIRGLEQVGLVWDVKVPNKEAIAAKQKSS